MKKKRNILLGLTFVFLTSTVIVWADPYNNENTLQRGSEFIQENTGDGTVLRTLENKTLLKVASPTEIKNSEDLISSIASSKSGYNLPNGLLSSIIISLFNSASKRNTIKPSILLSNSIHQEFQCLIHELSQILLDQL